MKILSIYRATAALDLKNVRRDDLLAWVGAAPVALALLYRLGIPPLAAFLERKAGFDLAPYHPLLMSFFLLMAPGMVGMVTGFLLLDERDEGSLTALLVTPMPLAGYLLYRCLGPLLIGFATSVAVYPLAGLVPLPFADLIVIALVASLTAPATALFLAAFAENKIAGFAMVKVLNTVNMLPVAAWFVRPPWQLAAGVIPAYWPMKMVWLAAEGRPYAAYALPGLAAYGLVTGLLLRRFRSRLLRG